MSTWKGPKTRAFIVRAPGAQRSARGTDVLQNERAAANSRRMVATLPVYEAIRRMPAGVGGGAGLGPAPFEQARRSKEPLGH